MLHLVDRLGNRGGEVGLDLENSASTPLLASRYFMDRFLCLSKSCLSFHGYVECKWEAHI